MDLTIVVAIAQLLTSLVAVFGIVLSVQTALQQRKYNEKDNSISEDDIATDVHKQFAEMWFMMDGIFIEYPDLHKYFYPSEAENAMSMASIDNNDFRSKLPPKGNELERAICIAEKFRDVFQYSENMALKIVKTYHADCASYYMYMQRIQSTMVYQEMNKRNPINIESIKEGTECCGGKKTIGSELKDKLEGMGYSFGENDYTYKENTYRT